MQPLIIGIGLCMLALSGGLAGLGHYDGVLGATSAADFEGPELPSEARMRIRISGTPEEARSQFGAIRSTFVLPLAMEESMASGRWLPVEILFESGATRDAYLETESSWAPGTVLVVEGTPRAYWPLMDTGRDLETASAVLFIRAVEAHEPILFKR